LAAATTDQTFVVVGGGQAGGRAVEGIRKAGFDGAVILLGEEARAPYERPPLSKQVLTGAAEPDSAKLRADGWYAEQGVDLRLSTRAGRINRSRKRVVLEDGQELAYDRLLLATGAQPRVPDLPGAELAGVHVLRDVDDSLALRDAMRAGARVALVGGGYIGLEVAAAARKLGCETTILEAAPSLMRRQVAPDLGDWYARLHRDHGADVRLEAEVSRLLGSDRVEGVDLADGGRVDADLVVIGVGIRPNVELAMQAGLEAGDGIEVDDQGRTSDPDIFAAGDVTRQPNPYVDGKLRLESWQNAQNQALVAGQAMAGAEDVRHGDLPWFWSDQHGINLQMIGMPTGQPRHVWRGDPAAGPGFTLFYLDDAGRLVGANAVDRPADIAAARRMIERGVSPDPDKLADPEVSMKKLLKGQA
jgi:3-phenylpropionate/trans-cinnamate dioxygenase ferredoxin reductase subunit